MIRLTSSLMKKLPHPVHQYGSISASASLEVELGNDADPVAQAELLFRRLDAALDRELQRQAEASLVAAPEQAANSTTSRVAPTDMPATAARTARPYSSKVRQPAPVTTSQLRFLDSLLKKSGTDVTAILHEFEIGALDQLSCKDAARLIDDLKAKASAR